MANAGLLRSDEGSLAGETKGSNGGRPARRGAVAEDMKRGEGHAAA